jgi:hypothetical protein
MLRVIVSIAFAGFLLMIVMGRYAPNPTSPESAMWAVGWVGIVALVYSAMNSFDALRHSLGRPTRLVYVGLLFSFLPLLVAAYSIAVWQYSPTKLSTFQIIAMMYGGLAAIVDLTLFSWLTFGYARNSIRQSQK